MSGPNSILEGPAQNHFDPKLMTRNRLCGSLKRQSWSLSDKYLGTLTTELPGCVLDMQPVPLRPDGIYLLRNWQDFSPVFVLNLRSYTLPDHP